MKPFAILRAWLWQVVIGLDQLLNALLGGWADETLSSRAWRSEQRGRRPGIWLRPLIDAIFFWQAGHCRESYLSEASGFQLPPELRPTPAEQAATEGAA
jgi:hypothetical protein